MRRPILPIHLLNSAVSCNEDETRANSPVYLCRVWNLCSIDSAASHGKFSSPFLLRLYFLCLRVNVPTDQINSKISGDTCKIDYAQTLWSGGVLCPKTRSLICSNIAFFSRNTLLTTIAIKFYSRLIEVIP